MLSLGQGCYLTSSTDEEIFMQIVRDQPFRQEFFLFCESRCYL